MKFYLEKNWSEQFDYYDKTPGYFAGRKQEIKGIINIIKNNDSSTILISSVRGVGKTSFVHKALYDIKNQIIPFFINIGHTLSIEGIDKDKKKILISIIRHAYWTDTEDKEIEQLYFDCVGKTTIEDDKEEKTQINNEKNFVNKIKPDTETIIAFIGTFTTAIGLAVPWFLWLKILFGFLGMLTIFFSSKWQIIYEKVVSNRRKNIIDDGTDYLEIRFEKWLKEKNKKENKKLVFIIDELDKIEAKDAFNFIKEYKNLFTRSKGHFIFISSQEAFDLTQKDRSLTIKDGGVFPTFFTHIFYLALPSTNEIKEYLEKIILNNIKHKQQKEDLISYLLFKSGNDFFDLKRLISNVLLFGENDKLFIDTDKLFENDRYYSEKSLLFKWVNKWFVEKNWSQLKINWKDNSEFQKTVLFFLNTTYPNNFLESSIADNETLTKLTTFLVNIGHYSTRTATVEDEIDGEQVQEGETIYFCTNTYNRDDLEAPLTEDDKVFLKSFTELIKIANDLDDLPNVINKTTEFKNYKKVEEHRDGEDISGINLYSVYSNFKDIYSNLEKTSLRINLTTEKVTSAIKIINEQLINIKSRYFEILNNFIDIHTDKGVINGKYTILSPDYSIRPTFESLPDFLSAINSPEENSAVWCNSEKGKYVLLIKNFQNESQIKKSLEALNNNRNLLIINLINDKNFKISNPKLKFKKKNIVVSNFINYKFNDFRYYIDIFNKIEKHLNK